MPGLVAVGVLMKSVADGVFVEVAGASIFESERITIAVPAMHSNPTMTRTAGRAIFLRFSGESKFDDCFVGALIFLFTAVTPR